jgi:hypothetical protein
MCHVTNKHLVWPDLKEPEYPEGLGTLSTQADQDLRMSGQASQALCRAAMALIIDHIWEKSLAQQIEQGPDLGGRRLRMLYELDASH